MLSSLTLRKITPPIETTSPPPIDPNKPTYNFFIKDNDEPPNHYSIIVRANQDFGPVLTNFCTRNNKRFRFDWNFVVLAPASAYEDSNNQGLYVLKWSMKPRDFMDEDAPVLKEGGVIHLVEGSLEKQKIGGAEQENDGARSQRDAVLQEKEDKIRQLAAQLTEALALIDLLKKENESLKEKVAEKAPQREAVPHQSLFNTQGWGRSVLMGKRKKVDATETEMLEE